MFTGLIQSQGKVLKKTEQGNQIHFVFEWGENIPKMKLGESIAVNGVCLTASRVQGKSFHADVIGETLKATNLGLLSLGDFVNLERSLKWGDAIGGHFVSGHVDGIGVIQKIVREGRNQTFTIQAPAALKKFLVPKGSIAVDGVSLTIQSVQAERFTVGLVPHTLQETNLGKCRPGNKVNLEVDILARYLLQKKGTGLTLNPDLSLFLTKPSKKTSPLNISTLKNQGF